MWDKLDTASAEFDPPFLCAGRTVLQRRLHARTRTSCRLCCPPVSARVVSEQHRVASCWPAA